MLSVIRTAVLAVLLAVAPALAAAEPAPPPRPKVPTVVVRSVKPADDTAAASRSFVTSYGLTARDLDLVRKLPGVAGAVPLRHIPAEIRRLARATSSRVVATVPDFATVSSVKTSAGRFPTEEDAADKENVCVLGSEVAAKLFPVGNPLGESVEVRGHHFKVVGVLAETRGSADHDVFVPLATARARFGEIIFIRTAGARTGEKVELHEIIIRVADPDARAAVADAVREVLKKEHAKGDWEVTRP